MNNIDDLPKIRAFYKAPRKNKQIRLKSNGRINPDNTYFEFIYSDIFPIDTVNAPIGIDVGNEIDELNKNVNSRAKSHGIYESFTKSELDIEIEMFSGEVKSLWLSIKKSFGEKGYISKAVCINNKDFKEIKKHSKFSIYLIHVSKQHENINSANDIFSKNDLYEELNTDFRISPGVIYYFNNLYEKNIVSFEDKIIEIYNAFEDHSLICTNLIIIIGMIGTQPLDKLYYIIENGIRSEYMKEINNSLMVIECWRTKECLEILKRTDELFKGKDLYPYQCLRNYENSILKNLEKDFE